MKFLSDMAHEWNISLFHYRNHGAEYGSVLVGIQIPAVDRPAFQKFLTTLAYEYWDETENPAYRFFL